MVRNQRSQLRQRQQRDSYLKKVKNEKVKTESKDLQRQAEQSQSQEESRQKKSSEGKSSAFKKLVQKARKEFICLIERGY